MEVEDVYFNIDEKVSKRIVLFEKNSFKPFWITMDIKYQYPRRITWYRNIDGDNFLVRKSLKEDSRANINEELLNKMYTVLIGKNQGCLIYIEDTIKLKQK